MYYKCLACENKSLFSKHQKTNLYCSNKCQAEYQSYLKLEEWKKTGIVEGKSLQVPVWLKRYVLEKQNGACLKCGITEWQGEKLVLEFEHIDGNSENNKEENVCCLCPNCHSQTPTYKAKNIGNGRKHRKKL
jgi:hypothetical protein